MQTIFFFCLRSCEYTKIAYHQRTVQFRFKYLQFHDKHGTIPQDAPDYISLSTKAVTSFLDTHKKSFRVESSTIDTTGVLHGKPVPAATHRYLHLWAYYTPLDTLNCSYYPILSSPAKLVRSLQITSLIRSHTAKIGFNNWVSTPIELEPTH